MTESPDRAPGPVTVAAPSGSERARAAFTERSATFIGSFALAGRVVERLAAFGQIVLIASVYGSNVQADLYFGASIVPIAIGTIIGESLAASILPPLVRRKTREELTGLISAGFWISLGLIVAISLLYLGAVVPVVEFRLNGELSRIGPWLAFTPIALALGLSGYFGAVLLQFERYVWPPFRSAVTAVGGLLLTVVVLTLTHDILWVAAAVSAGYAVSLALLLVEVKQVAGLGWLDRPGGEFVREAFRLRKKVAASVASGLLGGQVFVLIERGLAVTFGVGGVATLSYGRGVAFTPNVVGQSISAGLYPGMVRAHEAKHQACVSERFLRGLRLTLFVSIGFATLLAVYGPNLIGFLLQRGAFHADSVSEVGRVLSAFSLALFGNMLMIFAARVFYSVDFFQAAVWAQGAALVVYLAAALPMRAAWGPTGLAAAFGVAEVGGGVFAIVLAARRLELAAWTVARRAVFPGVRFGMRVALALIIYRLLLESSWLTVPLSLKGVAVVGGGLLVGAVTAGKALWTSGWPEAQRLKDGAWKLLLLAFRR